MSQGQDERATRTVRRAEVDAGSYSYSELPGTLRRRLDRHYKNKHEPRIINTVAVSDFR